MSSLHDSSVAVISCWAVFIVLGLYAWLAIASYMLDRFFILLANLQDRIDSKERGDVHERMHTLMNKKEDK